MSALATVYQQFADVEELFHGLEKRWAFLRKPISALKPDFFVNFTENWLFDAPHQLFSSAANTLSEPDERGPGVST